MDDMDKSELDSLTRERLRRLRAEEVRYRAEIEAEARMRVAAQSTPRRVIAGIAKGIAWMVGGIVAFLVAIVVFA